MTKTVKPAAANSGHRTKTENECGSLHSSSSTVFYPQNAGKSIRLRTANGKIAGTFNPRTGTFAKTCRHEHVLRKPPAIAYDKTVVVELKRLGCTTLRVLMDDGGVLTASFQTLLECGFELDRGHGRQIALPLQRWTRQNPAQFALAFEEVRK